MTADLTPGQLKALSATERVASCFSVLGILFVFATFWLSPHFNKSINRQIFYASIANLCVNVASFISENGAMAGQQSALCQFQAFVVQMFLGVDAFWSCCMALNVYLIFFHKYTIGQLRSLDWRYLLGCYGASFVPAFVYLFIETKARGKVYGPAIIWCWITVEWDPLRMATLYCFVWLAIFLAFTVYCMAARTVWRKRKELPGFLNPLNEDPFRNMVTTEINIVSQPREHFSPVSTRAEDDIAILQPTGPGGEYNPYSVDVEVGPQESRRRPSMPSELMRLRSLTRTAAVNEMNAEAWLYARTSFLFFLALLITWVPSSINRCYALAHPKDVNFGLNYASSLVFPLQGFWNTIVYIITSRTASGVYLAGALFSLGFFFFIDAATYSASLKNGSDVNIKFVDWIPGICSSLGMLVINSIEKTRLSADSYSYSGTGVAWKARLVLFLGFALMAGGLAGSVAVLVLKYVVPEYPFPTLYFGVANVIANGLIMLSSVVLWVAQNMEDDYTYNLAL